MASSWGVQSHIRPHLGSVTATVSSRNTLCGSGPTTSICAHRLHTSMQPQPCYGACMMWTFKEGGCISRSQQRMSVFGSDAESWEISATDRHYAVASHIGPQKQEHNQSAPQMDMDVIVDSLLPAQCISQRREQVRRDSSVLLRREGRAPCGRGSSCAAGAQASRQP